MPSDLHEHPAPAALTESVEDLIAEASVMESPTVMVTDLIAALEADAAGGSQTVKDLQGALGLIAASMGGECEHSTSGIGSCFDTGRTADARYGCDKACAPCVAHYALSGRDVPTGIGAEAQAEDRQVQVSEAHASPPVTANFYVSDGTFDVRFPINGQLVDLTENEVIVLRISAGHTCAESDALVYSINKYAPHDATYGEEILTAMSYLGSRERRREVGEVSDASLPDWDVFVDMVAFEEWMQRHRPDWFVAASWKPSQPDQNDQPDQSGDLR